MMTLEYFTKTYWNKFTNADSFELLPQFPDECVDAIITDPPYNLNLDKQDFIHEQFLRISRGVIIVFSPPENQWLPADQYLFWVKPISTKNTSARYSRFVEMIFVYRKTNWDATRHWSQYPNVFTDLVDTKIHPHRKPASLIKRLVLNHTKANQIILDPFAGSGVVQEICQTTNRKFVCIDCLPLSTKGYNLKHLSQKINV